MEMNIFIMNKNAALLEHVGEKGNLLFEDKDNMYVTWMMLS